MPRARPTAQVRSVLEMKAQGLSDRTVASRTGVPVNTVRLWRRAGLSQAARRELAPTRFCRTCGASPHRFDLLPAEYAYLFAIYLGDGCLSRNGPSWTLRIALDAAYPNIIVECCDAIDALGPAGRRPSPRGDPRCEHCARIDSTWKQWACLFPQHGPGRKHHRSIKLRDWQRKLIEAEPKPFLRGLIQTDGWRGVNRVHSKGKTYTYPRYQFSNRSDDIRQLFTDACDRVGVAWRPWTSYHISVAQRESVALLDSFIGPKT